MSRINTTGWRSRSEAGEPGHSFSINLRPTAIALAVAALACLGLAACGSSSSGSSSSASTPATTTPPEATSTPTTTTPPEATTPATTTPSTTPEASAAHRRLLAAAVAKCLRSNGAQVAEPNAEGFLKLEGPATHTPQFHAAVTKCHSVIAEAFAGTSAQK
jgi:hypothetical protein